jgi:CheY-like chemotaxis protein
VLLNLLTNAIKFTHQGGVTLRVGLVAPPSHIVRFQVEDTGQGIAPQDSKHIFEPFQQVTTNQQSSEGVGLGLTISRHLVQKMGGDLRVVSTPGQGSTFWFDLPLSEAVDTPPARDTQRRISAVQGRQPRILVVDDVDNNRAILVKQLAPLGFVVQEATSAAEGLAHAAAHHPEAIIVDLRLPDSTGLALIRQLREQPTLKETVMIASSASVFAEDWQQSMDAGAHDFLPKPIKKGQLLELLGRHLRLQWRYADDDGQEHRAVSLTALTAEQVPPRDELVRLYELATMGHAAALQTQAAELAEADERYALFAGEVERQARALQINELCTFLEQYLER